MIFKYAVVSKDHQGPRGLVLFIFMSHCFYFFGVGFPPSVAMERGLGDGGGPGVGAVAPYVKLRSACETLSGSGCHHLRVWVRDCQHYWRHRLTLNLSRYDFIG